MITGDQREWDPNDLGVWINLAIFANINIASKYVSSPFNVLPLAPLVHGFTSEPERWNIMILNQICDEIFSTKTLQSI